MSESTIEVRVKEIIVENAETKTFIFERTDGQTLLYKAGQFLTFLISLHGHEVRRSYSMSSAPAADRNPSITIKRVPNGEISRLWIDTVKTGDLFTVLPPAGRFVLEQHVQEAREIFLIGGGSGITPLFSLLKQTLVTEPASRVTLIYASRNVRNTLFWEAIQDWEQRYSDRLSVVHVHSQPSDEWTGIRGRINNSRLETLVNRHLHLPHHAARFFLCGPYELMRSVEITLHFMGFSKEQIRKENFIIPAIPLPPPISYPHTIELQFAGRSYNLPVPAHATILDAALAADIKLPYSCKGGRCSTCAAICTRGAVHMSVNEVLTDKELAEGWILTCCTYVDSDDVRVVFQ
ncbi:ferredoxin--NADP reductase [Dyadobacter sandarakinus]|uniref:Ferredoxin--NADP reductase n=1 Tax=Dyadobacter sandarakinus TaxID=2747268 RepID=A0ABX7I6Y1_9BACT|nr:ferredoxin--NADP reductase [Dyadobacter sandarakinus]QRR01862.1 ferredoxin--NADP reductase [Dyadobacter sandarakinus]